MNNNFVQAVGHYITIETPYKFLRILGQGQSAYVLLVEAKDSKQKYALKILNEVAKKQSWKVNAILSEIELLKVLNHPRIPGIIEENNFNGSPFFIMDYFEGVSLSEIDKEHYDKTFLFHLAKELLEILVYLHDQSIIHRDIHAGNLVLQNGTDVCLIDFGISMHCTGTEKAFDSRLNRRAVSPATDLYSIGEIILQFSLGVDQIDEVKNSWKTADVFTKEEIYFIQRLIGEVEMFMSAEEALDYINSFNIVTQ